MLNCIIKLVTFSKTSKYIKKALNFLTYPKFELPKLIIWHNNGLTTATFVDCLNLPIFRRNLAQYRPYTKPIVTFTMASSSESRRDRIRPMDGTLLRRVSLLPRQTILEVRKSEFGKALARCCAENRCWRPEFG